MKNILTTPHAPRTIAEAGLLRPRGSLYMESRIDEQLGILPEEARRVRSMMCSALTVVSPDTSLGEAVSVMRAMNVPVLVVYEGRRLVGMGTEHEMAGDQSGGVKPKHGVVASLMRPDHPGEYYPQCKPDGQWIVYQSGGNFPTLWKLPTGGGDAIQLTKTTASRPSQSPDGKFIAYHYLDSSLKPSRWGIGISSTEDGTRVKRFDFSPTVVERLVKWTPDGKNIAFLNNPNGIPNIWLQPLDGGEPKPLTDFPSENIIAFNWNADGRQLAVIRGVETSDVLLINRTLK